MKKIDFENFLNLNSSMKLERISEKEVSLDSSCQEESNDISHVGFWLKITKNYFRVKNPHPPTSGGYTGLRGGHIEKRGPDSDSARKTASGS